MIKQQEYAERRRRLLAQCEPGSVIIVASADELIRNGDVHFPFRQDSHFYYLTGFPENQAVLILRRGVESDHDETILFCKPPQPTEELWTGPIIGQLVACDQYGVDEAYAITVLDEKMPELLAGAKHVYWPIGAEDVLTCKVTHCIDGLRAKVRSGVVAPEIFYDIRPLISELRLIKSPAELEILRQGAEITAFAHEKAMQKTEPGLYEYEIEAELLYEFTRHGARAVAYGSIVGGGANACVLHYVKNDAILRDGDLLLIDAGCEWQNYACDVTRTFPVNGRFSTEQKAIYELVLSAQQAVINIIKPGVEWLALQEIGIAVITEGLVKLGLLTGKVSELIRQRAYTRFYMHNIGHWMGIDVHDVGAYKENNAWRKLQSGMVFTVEPGIYISAGEAGVDKKWWNIGVRIEDDVAVTATGCEILTLAIPKTVAEIEALMV